jgi:multiple sugar transport system permease protein
VTFFFGPILIMAMASLHTRLDLYGGPASLFLSAPTTAVWKNLLQHPGLPRYTLNSLLVAFAGTGISLALGTSAAYGLARSRLPILEKVCFLILCIRMLPPVVMALPLFLLMKKADLLDTRLAVIAAHTAFNLPFVIWMMREFIRVLPIELEESGMVDGLTRMQAFRRILLPLLWPSLVAVGIFCVVFSFSEFLLALILTQNTAKTLPVFIGEMDWHRASAAGTAFLMPVLGFGLVVQKHLTRGLSFGAVAR